MSERVRARGLFSFFTSCFGSHGFVDQSRSVCVLYARHEDSAGSAGESVEQSLTGEHEGSLWRWKKRLSLSVGGNISFNVYLNLCYSCTTDDLLIVFTAVACWNSKPLIWRTSALSRKGGPQTSIFFFTSVSIFKILNL